MCVEQLVFAPTVRLTDEKKKSCSPKSDKLDTLISLISNQVTLQQKHYKKLLKKEKQDPTQTNPKGTGKTPDKGTTPKTEATTNQEETISQEKIQGRDTLHKTKTTPNRKTTLNLRQKRLSQIRTEDIHKKEDRTGPKKGDPKVNLEITHPR